MLRLKYFFFNVIFFKCVSWDFFIISNKNLFCIISKKGFIVRFLGGFQSGREIVELGFGLSGIKGRFGDLGSRDEWIFGYLGIEVGMDREGFFDLVGY